ncbi:unnamed protein product [Trichogramma brassicae]|uniref:Uncharacterized protein n=1 Tax=Trichogramma brassicae TaxID=86971 RepID=A0A6H5IEA1_9HYME|nr:unnamed protein product [Trichogramma brassicae]
MVTPNDVGAPTKNSTPYLIRLLGLANRSWSLSPQRGLCSDTHACPGDCVRKRNPQQKYLLVRIRSFRITPVHITEKRHRSKRGHGRMTRRRIRVRVITVKILDIVTQYSGAIVPDTARRFNACKSNIKNAAGPRYRKSLPNFLMYDIFLKFFYESMKMTEKSKKSIAPSVKCKYAKVRASSSAFSRNKAYAKKLHVLKKYHGLYQREILLLRFFLLFIYIGYSASLWAVAVCKQSSNFLI